MRKGHLCFSESSMDDVSIKTGESTSQIGLGFPKSDHSGHNFMIVQGEFGCGGKLGLRISRKVNLYLGHFYDFSPDGRQ